MYNRIILLGNLTKDIELRYTQSGSAIGNTSIATSRKFKNANGEQSEETLFVDITMFGRTAEIANQYLRKGSQVLIEGRLKLDQWTAQDGTKRSKHSVVVESLKMLGDKSDNQQPRQQHSEQPPQQQYQQPQQRTTPPLPEADINEDEIPF